MVMNATVKSDFIFYSCNIEGKREVFAFDKNKHDNGLYSLNTIENKFLDKAAAAGRYTEVLNTLQHEKVNDENSIDLIKKVIGREYVFGSFRHESNNYTKIIYNAIKEVNEKLFKLIPFPVIFTDKDEYQTAAEMRQRVQKEKVIYIYTGFSGHEYFNKHENSIGRAVHDVFSHLVCGCPFTFRGEYSAYLEQRKYFPRFTWAVLFAEIPAQTAAYYYNNDFSFKQRAIEAPARWLKMCKGIEKDYSHNAIMDPFSDYYLQPGL